MEHFRLRPTSLLLRLIVFLAAATLPAAELNIVKRPYEEINLGYDFATCSCLGSSGITLVSVTATKTTTGVDSSSTIIAASPVPAVVSMTKKVVFRVKGGAEGDKYTLAIRVVVTDSGEKLEGRINLLVRGDI